MFYKISSKYHTGLISDDWIQSQSVHMIIHYTTCGQICRLTLPDRGKNLYSQQNCIPALITTESCLTRSWFYKVALITSPWVFVYLVPALPWRYRMTGWLNWKLLSYHSASFAWASLHITEGIVCLRERERERERERWQDIPKRYTAVTTLLPTHDIVKRRTVSRHGSVQRFEVVSCSCICSKIQ